MFYRVTADILFQIPDEGTDFFHDCEIALGKGVTINPGQPNEEKSRILWQRCYHDDDPTKPCEVIEEHTSS